MTFIRNPTVWNDACHKHPTSETRHLDAVVAVICLIRLIIRVFGNPF